MRNAKREECGMVGFAPNTRSTVAISEIKIHIGYGIFVWDGKEITC